MANSNSSKKRIRIANRNRLQNRIYKGSVRSFTKVFVKNKEKFEDESSTKNFNDILKSRKDIYSSMDKATKKKVLHKNYAARKKSNLTAQINKILWIGISKLLEIDDYKN